VHAGGGRFIRLTVWESKHYMQAAREALGPVVGRLLEPMMTAPVQLLATGPVVVDDSSAHAGTR
jgi:hypothetical protein